jgi:hypothetical protein
MKSQKTVRIDQTTIARAERLVPRLRGERAFYSRQPSLHAALVLAIHRGLAMLSATLPPLSAA